MQNNYSQKLGFTIAELIVIIAVIGILAAVTLVAYNGFQDSARQTLLMSDLDNAVSVLDLDLSKNGVYPATVALADNGNGLPASSGTTYSYAVGSNTVSPTFCLTANSGTQRYMISQDGPSRPGGCNLLANSATELTGANEFLRYADLAPIIDLYGLISYTASFDIKSANTSVQNTAVVYMQNGSGSKYGFVYVSIPVTTSYVRQTVTGTVTNSNLSFTEAFLAFYGTYGTGNILSVKNLKIEFGSTASAWTPAP